MNQPTRNAIAEDSPQRMDVIEKRAMAQARSDKRYRPITLELTRSSVGQYTVGGWDTFDLDVRDISDGGRVRQNITVVIAGKFADFVEHPDYDGLMIHIPATERNLKCLASAHRDNKWTIKQDDIAEQVAEASSKIVPMRNAEAENALPDIMGHVESEEDALRVRVAQLEGQLLRQEPPVEETHVGQPSIPAPAASNTESPELQVEKVAADDKALTDRAKAEVHAEHAEEIEVLKKKARNFWLTKEYRDKFLPLILAKKEELCTQPAK